MIPRVPHPFAQRRDGSPFADQSTYIDPTGTGHPSANTGITYGFDHSTLLAELATLRTFINSEPSTAILDVSGGNAGQLEASSTVAGATLAVGAASSLGGVSATLTVGAGLNVIDITTGSNDFLLNEANLVIDGPADSFVIFRLPDSDNMLVSDSNILYGDSGIQRMNIMFYTDQAQNDTHYEVNNAILNGIALWSLGSNGGKSRAIALREFGDFGWLRCEEVRYEGGLVLGDRQGAENTTTLVVSNDYGQRRVQLLSEQQSADIVKKIEIACQEKGGTRKHRTLSQGCGDGAIDSVSASVGCNSQPLWLRRHKAIDVAHTQTVGDVQN